MKKMKQVNKNLPKSLEIRSTMSLNGGVDLASFFSCFFSMRLNCSQLSQFVSLFHLFLISL